MKFDFRIEPEAESEIIQIGRWYEQRKKGLGEEFFLAFEAILDDIRDRPLSFPIFDESTRRALMRPFPYIVFFLMIGDTVVVTSVLHTARRR